MQKRFMACALAVLVAVLIGVSSPTAVTAKAMDDCQYVMGQLSQAQRELADDFDFMDQLINSLSDPSTTPEMIPGIANMMDIVLNIWIPQDSAAVDSYAEQAHEAHCY